VVRRQHRCVPGRLRDPVRSLRREALTRDGARRRAYVRNTAILAALWAVYPVVVALGPHGAGVIGAVTETGWIAVVDLLAKVAYGLVSTHDSSTIAEGDLAQRS
jgi:bacteriorhodopsin